MPSTPARLRSTLVICLAALLGGCGGRTERHPDVQLLATDVHLSVADHTLVLPLVALEEHAGGGMSFSLHRRADAERADKRRAQFLRETGDRKHPLALDLVGVTVYSYGAGDYGAGRGQLCGLLTRQWSRSACDDSLRGVRAALPAHRFKLVNLARLQLNDPRSPANCLPDGKHTALPSEPGRGVIVCPALVYGGDVDEFHTAVVRIDRDLGAIWTVWRHGQSGESAESMAQREGQAITLFVQTALGTREDFLGLERGMRPLMRPGA